MSFNDDEPTSGRIRWMLGGLVLLSTAVLFVWWPGCREYPPVTSREALTLLRLLNSACNTRNVRSIEQAEKRLLELKGKGLMNPAEVESFEKILSLAKQGEWEAAEQSAFKMAEDQVGAGHPSPDQHDRKPVGATPRKP